MPKPYKDPIIPWEELEKDPLYFQTSGKIGSPEHTAWMAATRTGADEGSAAWWQNMTPETRRVLWGDATGKAAPPGGVFRDASPANWNVNYSVNPYAMPKSWTDVPKQTQDRFLSDMTKAGYDINDPMNTPIMEQLWGSWVMSTSGMEALRKQYEAGSTSRTAGGQALKAPTDKTFTSHGGIEKWVESQGLTPLGWRNSQSFSPGVADMGWVHPLTGEPLGAPLGMTDLAEQQAYLKKALDGQDPVWGPTGYFSNVGFNIDWMDNRTENTDVLTVGRFNPETGEWGDFQELTIDYQNIGGQLVPNIRNIQEALPSMQSRGNVSLEGLPDWAVTGQEARLGTGQTEKSAMWSQRAAGVQPKMGPPKAMDYTPQSWAALGLTKQREIMKQLDDAGINLEDWLAEVMYPWPTGRPTAIGFRPGSF